MEGRGESWSSSGSGKGDTDFKNLTATKAMTSHYVYGVGESKATNCISPDLILVQGNKVPMAENGTNTAI